MISPRKTVLIRLHQYVNLAEPVILWMVKVSTYSILEYNQVKDLILLQGDSSKMGQTLRLKPWFNTVPTQLCFQITVLTNAVVCLHWLA